MVDTNPKAGFIISAIEDEEPASTKDASRSQIKFLRAAIKSLLYKYHGRHITEKLIKDEVYNPTNNEVAVCQLIANLTMNYIPEKKYFYSVPHQIPFYLMANQILQTCGYDKFCSTLSPLSSPNTLHTIEVYAPTLFSLFSTNKKHKNLDMYDFDDEVISRKQRTTEEKGAVFDSIFSMPATTKIMNSYKLDPGYTMNILPGMISVRLQGTKRTSDKQSEITLASQVSSDAASEAPSLLSASSVLSTSADATSDASPVQSTFSSINGRIIHG